MKQSLDWIKKRTSNPNVQKSLFKKGHTLSKEAKEKMSDSQRLRFLKSPPWNKGLKGFRAGKGTRPNSIPRGKEHWNWKYDRTNIKDRNVPELKEWRTKVFTRDKFKCRIENKDCTGQLQAHHILRWADYPELRFDINNGITLCIAHHPRKIAEEKRLSPYFMELVSVSSD